MSRSSSSLGPNLAVIGGSILMLSMAASVMLSAGNTMGRMFFYMLIAGGIYGLLSPKKAFFLFMVECATLDLAKRLMIFGGTVSHTDLYYVLGIAPATIAGITAGLLMRIAFGQQKAGLSDFVRLGMAVGIMGAGGVLALRGGGGMSNAVKEVTDSYFYLILVFIIPLLFPTVDDIQRLWRKVIWLFVPVAFYGIYQQLDGFQDFEIDYLSTGLSIEIKQLASDRVRAFSTLNSPTSLSLICGELAAMSLLLTGLHRRNRRYGFSFPAGVCFAIIFLAGWLASTVRVGILLVPVAIMGSLLFRSRGKTLAFYMVSAAIFVSLVAVSPFMLHNIEGWTMRLQDLTGDNAFMANMLDANTYKDRLMGFANVLSNPAAYSLFGLGEEQLQGEFYNHDPLSTTLVKYGVVVLGIALFVAFNALRYLHNCVWSITDPSARYQALSCLAVAAGSVAVSMIGGNLMSTFPGNAFLAMPLGMILSLHRTSQAAAKAARNSSGSPNPATTPSPLPVQAVSNPMRPQTPWRSQRAPWQPAAGSSPKVR